MIIKAKKEDLKDILELQYIAYQSEAKLFKNTDIPPLKQTLDELCSEFKRGIILKAINGNHEIIGSVRAYLENGTAYIGKLMVHPSQQGKGIGTKMLLEVEKYFPQKRYELFTSTRSMKNIQMYERLGYKPFKEENISDELQFIYFEKIDF